MTNQALSAAAASVPLEQWVWQEKEGLASPMAQWDNRRLWLCYLKCQIIPWLKQKYNNISIRFQSNLPYLFIYLFYLYDYLTDLIFTEVHAGFFLHVHQLLLKTHLNLSLFFRLCA